ncbi:MAG: SpaH/EbpB family LPXTG-anchored major pilin [Lachnospiraceae bacterium]|nr:SpaH/EbpB family LPXTG-anchored major pilin [Lachnospiraceae bacterium]
MKRYLKKISALFLAFAMIMGMCVTAGAADSTTVTITNKSDEAENAEYYYLQIIAPDTESSTGWKFTSEKIATAVKSALGVTTDEEALKALTDETSGATAMEKAIEAVAAIIDTSDMTESSASIASDGTATFTLSSAGLYYIKAVDKNSKVAYNPMAVYVGYTYDNTTGAATLEPSASIEAKFTDIDVKKTNDVNGVAQIGSTVTYTITSTIPYISLAESDRKYYVTDTITGAEYTVNSSNAITVTVEVDGVADSFTFSATVTDTTVNGSAGQTFEVDLSKLLDDNKYAGQEIKISYTATITSVTAENTANVYREPGGYYSSGSSTVTTGQITLTKTGESDEALEGAKFVIYRVENETKMYLVIDNGAYTWVALGTGQSLTNIGAETFKTGSDGTVTVTGLDTAYTYYFEEIEAPDGYSVNETASEQSAWSTGVDSSGVYTATASMKDTKLSSLPSTGGFGTYLFTIIGVVVMAVMASLYFIKRRRDSAE